MLQDITHLGQLRVVHAEHVELELLLLYLFQLVFQVGADVFIFQLFQDLIGPLYDLWWHTGHARHVNAEAVLAAAFLQRAQEDHFIAGLLCTHMVIADAFKFCFQIDQFMIMCGKQSFCPRSRMLMQEFTQTPCYGYAIIG